MFYRQVNAQSHIQVRTFVIISYYYVMFNMINLKDFQKLTSLKNDGLSGCLVTKMPVPAC